MPAKSSTMSVPIAALRVDVNEACRLLGVSRAFLYMRVKAKQLSCVKEGRRTLFLMRELERYASEPGARPGRPVGAVSESLAR